MQHNRCVKTFSGRRASSGEALTPLLELIKFRGAKTLQQRLHSRKASARFTQIPLSDVVFIFEPSDGASALLT